MFFHNFKYAVKTLVKNKALVFWTFAFPIILGSLFTLAFSDLENGEKLQIINIAIVENSELDKNKSLKTAFDTLSIANDEKQIFSTKYVDKETAETLLNNNEIIGFLELTETEPKISVKSNGIEQTVFKNAVEEINAASKIINDLAEQEIKTQIENGNFEINYEKIYQDAAEKVQTEEATFIDNSSEHLSYTMIEFYTLIAMACLYGGMLGAVAVNQNLANMSSKGKRVSVSPAHKATLILSSALAGYLVQTIGLIILFIYTIFVLGANYGDNLPLIILLAFAGSFAGLTFGIAIATVIKANDNIKTGIVVAVTMTGCFFAGMMGPQIKYFIDQTAPIVNAINPANLITDGFYALYYYDTPNRYLGNLVGLLAMSLVFITISYFSLRRQKYDSL
ncbi:ABC transporter permease [Candidatus Saccharibacteria bacterium]|nr:ABC transporter permease [Candidatus Saccharibacteria bacterium]